MLARAIFGKYESPLDEPFVVCLVANDLRLYSLILICELILFLAVMVSFKGFSTLISTPLTAEAK